MSGDVMLDFLGDLRENNSLDWMHANEKRKKEAVAAFTAFVQDLIFELGKSNADIARLEAKDLLFRLNRDTRFSDDKSPYNPTFRAHISPAGRQPIPVGYYLAITPGGSFAGGGLFAPHFADAIKRVRNHLAADGDAFLSIVEEPRFKETFEFIGMPLKRVPKEFDSEHPLGEYLKCKCWSIEGAIPDEVIRDPKACKEAFLERFALMESFNDYLNVALDGFEMPKR